MSVAIRISEDEYEAAKKTAKIQHRSIQGQIEYWTKVGRCATENPDLPIPFILELLSTDWHDQSDITPFTFGEDA